MQDMWILCCIRKKPLFNKGLLVVDVIFLYNSFCIFVQFVFAIIIFFNPGAKVAVICANYIRVLFILS
jgi:hypothetical protein